MQRASAYFRRERARAMDQKRSQSRSCSVELFGKLRNYETLRFLESALKA